MLITDGATTGGEWMVKDGRVQRQCVCKKDYNSDVHLGSVHLSANVKTEMGNMNMRKFWEELNDCLENLRGGG